MASRVLSLVGFYIWCEVDDYRAVVWACRAMLGSLGMVRDAGFPTGRQARLHQLHGQSPAHVDFSCFCLADVGKHRALMV